MWSAWESELLAEGPDEAAEQTGQTAGGLPSEPAQTEFPFVDGVARPAVGSVVVNPVDRSVPAGEVDCLFDA